MVPGKGSTCLKTYAKYRIRGGEEEKEYNSLGGEKGPTGDYYYG